jgi:HEAT repeat protein
MAATAIAALPSAEERFALTTRALGDADLAVRTPAATILGPLGRAESLDLLLKQLGAGYEPLRLEARSALVTAAQTNKDLAQPLATKAAAMLDDSQADRRIDASFLLGVLASHEGFEKHLALLNDSDWRVVAQAATSMGAIGDPAAGAPLVGVYRRAAGIDKPASPATPATPGAQRSEEEAIVRGNAGEQAILSCAKLGHKQILDETKAIYGQKMASSQWRSAALWALGVLGTTEQVTQGARPVLARLRDPEESGGVLIEAIRALGNGRVKAAVPQLKQIRDSREVFEYALAASRSLDYINGTNTPMEPEVSTTEPETSIRALTPVAR